MTTEEKQQCKKDGKLSKLCMVLKISEDKGLSIGIYTERGRELTQEKIICGVASKIMKGRDKSHVRKLKKKY